MGEESSSIGSNSSSGCSESKQVRHELLESSCQEPCSLEQAVEVVSSLITLSHSVKVFTTKWQSIRDRLEELLTSLTAIENCDSSENPSVIGALKSIAVTLQSCHELARRCVELSYSGKLLMQSDLDIVCARLDSDLKNLCGIYTLGLLNHKYAIVLSRPNLGASRDDMKIYIKDLLSRLKVGSADMKKQALLAFNEVIQVQEGDKYVKIASEVDGFMVLLVNFLDLQENQIREEAAKALSLIAGYENYRGLLIGAGIIAPLTRVLDCGSELSKESAARCLQKLTENSENAWSISAHGGVTSLLKICTSVDSGGELICLSCGVLKNLVGVEEVKRFLVEGGGIPSFIRLARSTDGVTQICSIDFLQSIASGDESIKQIIVKEGGVRALVRVLDPKSLFPSKAREMALKGIMSICSSSVNSSETLLFSYGFLDHILYFLGHGEVSTQELGLKAAFWLCGTSEEAKKAMGEAGFMQELVKFLDSCSFDIREMAAETLYSMILVPRNRKRFVQNDQNVGIVLQMLDKEMEVINSGNKKLLLTLLMSLTNCNSARKKIVSSGYLKKIEKLAETENSEAKKIVRKLSSNRLRSFLNGIWHQ